MFCGTFETALPRNAGNEEFPWKFLWNNVPWEFLRMFGGNFQTAFPRNIPVEHCLYVGMSVCLYVCRSECLYVCMSICQFLCMYVCSVGERNSIPPEHRLLCRLGSLGLKAVGGGASPLGVFNNS